VACAVFFERDRVTVEKAPDRARGELGAVLALEQFSELDKGNVHLRLNRA